MGCNHNHNHINTRNLVFTIFLNLFISISQFIGGFISGSSALLSDATHNLSDVFSLIVSYISNKLMSKTPNENYTFGFRRAEIFGATLNGALLIILSFFLIIESTSHILEPEPVNALIVITLAGIAGLFNLLSAFMLYKDSKHNLNMKGAYLHMLSDAMNSFAVVIGGIIVYFTELFVVDALIGLLVAIYLMYLGWGLLKDTLKIFMQFSPDHISINSVISHILTHNEISDAHHAHLWQLNENETHFEAHLLFKENISLLEVTKIIEKIEAELSNEFQINHTILQSEFEPKDSHANTGVHCQHHH